MKAFIWLHKETIIFEGGGGGGGGEIGLNFNWGRNYPEVPKYVVFNTDSYTELR